MINLRRQKSHATNLLHKLHSVECFFLHFSSPKTTVQNTNIYTYIYAECTRNVEIFKIYTHSARRKQIPTECIGFALRYRLLHTYCSLTFSVCIAFVFERFHNLFLKDSILCFWKIPYSVFKRFHTLFSIIDKTFTQQMFIPFASKNETYSDFY